jgi:hypothetical protein
LPLQPSARRKEPDESKLSTKGKLLACCAHYTEVADRALAHSCGLDKFRVCGDGLTVVVVAREIGFLIELVFVVFIIYQ